MRSPIILQESNFPHPVTITHIVMSLYHEAAAVLDAARGKGGSVKSIVFGKKDWKTDPKLLFALSTEAAKWSEVLAEVVERSGLLKAERQVSNIH